VVKTTILITGRSGLQGVSDIFRVE